jgi:hypothetical protein
MQRREFLRSSLGVVAAATIPGAPSLASETWVANPTRRILYEIGQFSQTKPDAIRIVVETIGGSGFNVLILSFLQASVSRSKLTLLYNGNEFPSLAPEVPALLARLRSGFGSRKRVMLSIGGWQELRTFKAIRSYGVPAFVRQLTEQVVVPLGLDGIDLDLEPQKGGLDQWMAVHDEYGKTLIELTNEYKRLHPTHTLTHAPISKVAAEFYTKPRPIPGMNKALLAATRGNQSNNIDWLNIQFYEGGIIEGGDIAGYYRDSLAAPLIHMQQQTGITTPLQFLTPLFEPEAKQPLAFCSRTMEAINRRCADLHAGKINGVALWDYGGVASSIRDWSQGLEAALHA